MSAARPIGVIAGRSIGLIAVAAASALLACGCTGRRPDEAPRGLWVRLQPGDTLGRIAERFHVPVEDLVAVNGLPDASHVRAGVELYVPEAGTRPRAHRPPPSHATLPSTGLGALPALIGRGAAAGAHGPLGVRLLWPVDAPISSPFGERDGKPHDGIDLAVAEGTPVRAAAAGLVVYAGDRLRGYGRLLVLRHDDHLVTIYAHNEKLLASEGARVAAGETIGLSGHTGNATAPHLHFEVREDGVALDPEPLLPPALPRLGNRQAHAFVAHH